MADKPKITDDPFAHLPRRSLFGETKIQPETKFEGETKIPPENVRQNSGRGRPAAVGKPWVAAGMSKAAWYRKRADAGA